MQKVVTLIIIAIGCIPLLVNADMEAPAIKIYKATINNIEGAKYYKYENGVLKEEGILEYGKNIKIEYESIIDDEVYGFANEGHINLKDIIITDDNFDLLSEGVNEVKYLPESNGTVLAKDGIKLHKGPANGFSIVGETIPKGTELKFIYEYNYNGGTAWYYVEYKNVKGWVCTLDGAIGFKSNDTYITSTKIKITENNKTVGIIPEHIVLNNIYRLDQWSSNNLYVTYNNMSGYINKANLANLYSSPQKQLFGEIISKVDRNLYEFANTKSKILNSNINDNEKIDIIAYIANHFIEWYYIDYNGTKGWVRCFDSDEYFKENEEVIEEQLPEDNESTKEDETEKKENKFSFSGEQIVLLSIGAAITIALTTFVTVVLINKKKKKNNGE